MLPEKNEFVKRFLLVIILFAFIFNLFALPILAQKATLKGSFRTEVSAAVGELYLNVSGYVSPYASIVMTTADGTFLRAAVADGFGNFYISQVLIRRGFSGFCLTAVDFKRLGESTTCFSFPPAQKNITMTDLFLPPTLGLFKTEIAAGQTAFAFGYTMPGAKVTLHLSNGRTLTTFADSKGYYEFNIRDLKAGKYLLFAKANYQNKDSLTPTKKILLKALSLWEQFLAFLRDLWGRLMSFFTSLALGPLWLAIPILILIIILILKLWPERFSFIYESKLLSFFSKKPKKKGLHHEWFIGF